MRIKHLIMALAVLAGIATSAAVQQWPAQASWLQMLLYSITVIGLLLVGLWPHRHQSRFWPGMCLVLLLHGLILFLMRSIFPFKTILVVIPFLVIEGVVAFILMLKLLGDGKQPRSL
jgi:cytochrome bd-type quinol oxidase subunit 2